MTLRIINQIIIQVEILRICRTKFWISCLMISLSLSRPITSKIAKTFLFLFEINLMLKWTSFGIFRIIWLKSLITFNCFIKSIANYQNNQRLTLFVLKITSKIYRLKITFLILISVFSKSSLLRLRNFAIISKFNVQLL